MARNHCFVSASSASGVRRWSWHAETPGGVPVRSCGREFDTFDECAKHAFVHGYAHIEVPVVGSFAAGRAQEAPAVADGDLPNDAADRDESEALDTSIVSLSVTAPAVPAAYRS